MKKRLPKTECLGMIKRLSASALVVLTVASCQQQQEKVAEENSNLVKKEEYKPRVIDVNKVRFMPPEIRSQELGEDWDKNKTLSDHIDPDNVKVKVDMSKDRQVKLNYTKQFALKVAAQNSKGYGSVSISSQWLKEGEKISFEAISDDKASFVKWVGDIKDGVEIKGNEISVVMNKPRTIFAVFASNENELKIDTQYGDPKGSGVYKRGDKAEWSVTSPFNISDSERVVAPVTKGSMDLTDDKVIKIDWQKEYLVKAGSNEMGSVKGGGWISKGKQVKLDAMPADKTIAFSHWEGVDAAMAKQNPLTLTVEKPYMPKAIFVKKQFMLKIATAHGEVSGAGLQANGSDAKWSVTSPVATDKKDIRLAAVPASGTVKMDGDKQVEVKWVKEFLVKVYQNKDGNKAPLGEYWVKEGEMLENVQAKFDPQVDKVYSWSGNLPKDKRGDYPLTVKVMEPMMLTANLTPIMNKLTFSNNIDKKDDTFEHMHTDMAAHNVPNVRYVNDGTRMVLDKGALKGQVDELTVQEAKKVKVENSSNIQVVDYEGWKNCVRIKTAFAQVIISPEAGRVVYYGSPDNKTNLLWLNDDYKGATTTKEQASQDWADKGGSRVWIAPFEARAVLLKRQFPPAYEVDGAPYKNVIISGNKVIVQNFASPEYGCTIERTFELKKNKLVIETALVKSSDTNNRYLLGPAMMTQFIRPDKITFGKSDQPADHVNGYAVLQGPAPEIKVNELDDARFTFEVPKENDSEWKVGSHTRFTQLEFKSYVMNIYSSYGKSAIFSEKNCNVTIYAPETPSDFIEVGNFGELYGLGAKHVSKLIWELEKR